MSALFVVNPAAGGDRGRDRWEKAAAALPKGGWRTAFTRAPGEGRALAREALERGVTTVVAVGGDGTFGEIVDGFFSVSADRRARAAVAVWPAGSGCDFARHFGLRADEAALKRLLEPRPPTFLDAVRVDYTGRDGRPARRHFANVAAFGLAGEVAARVERGGKRLGGLLSYLAASAAAVLSARAFELELVVDGEALPRARYHLVAAANTSTTGGGMKLAPGADAADGRFDLVLVEDMSRGALLRLLTGVYRGAHVGAPGVVHRLARTLEARSSREIRLNIDGELAGFLPARFEVLPGALPTRL